MYYFLYFIIACLLILFKCVSLLVLPVILATALLYNQKLGNSNTYIEIFVSKQTMTHIRKGGILIFIYLVLVSVGLTC